jgi:hypothetical protein
VRVGFVIQSEIRFIICERARAANSSRTETHLVARKSSIKRFAADEGEVASVIHRLFLPGLFGNADHKQLGIFQQIR